MSSPNMSQTRGFGPTPGSQPATPKRTNPVQTQGIGSTPGGQDCAFDRSSPVQKSGYGPAAPSGRDAPASRSGPTTTDGFGPNYGGADAIAARTSFPVNPSAAPIHKAMVSPNQHGAGGGTVKPLTR